MTRPQFRALSIYSQSGVLRVIASDAFVCPGFDPNALPVTQRPAYKKFTAIWDTGASSSVITQKIVTDCGLQPIGVRQVYHAAGMAMADVFLVNIGLINDVAFALVEVTRGDIYGADMLIGMDIIGAGDLTITNVGQRTVMSFRIPSIGAVDNVEQTKQHNRAPPMPKTKKKPKKHR